MSITLNKPISVDELEDTGKVPAPLTAEDVATLTLMGYSPITTLPKTDLLAILREHEIAVYRPEDIEGYKLKMVSHAVRLANKWIPIGMTAALAQVAAGFVVLNHDWLPYVFWGTGGVTGVVTFLYTIGTTAPRASWDPTCFNRYKREVPGPVLATIARLRRANFGIEFEVEDLQVRKREVDQYGIFDPLLFVSLRGARYCIAVWDEPKFTAKPMH